MSLPLHRLDRARIPCDRAHLLLAAHQPAWGFPLSCVRRRGRREEGEWGKRGEGGSRAPRRCQCAKTGDRLCSCGAGPVTARGPEPSATGGRPEQSKEQGTTVNIYTAPLSSSCRRRLHHRPAVSAVASFPLAPFALSSACERAIEPPSAGSPPFAHEWVSNRAIHVMTSHRSDPLSPCRVSLCTRKHFASGLVEPRATPRRAAVPRTPVSRPSRQARRQPGGQGGLEPPYGAPACRVPPQIVLMYIQLGGAEKNTQTYFCILGQLICFYLLRPNKEQPTKMKTLFLS
jgi:hypothetical protein